MTETPKPTVYEAWSAAMGDLREIKKGERTTGGSKFDFRGVDAVMNACGPVFRTHEIAVIPTSIKEAKHRDYTAKSGALMHEAIVTVGYTIYGPAGDSMVGESIGESSDASDKSTTQAMSVAYRTFLLQSMTMPTDEKDPDHSDAGRRADSAPAPQAEVKPPFTADEAAAAHKDLHGQIAELAEPGFSTLVKWLETEGITDKTLTRDQAREWYSRMSALPKRQVGEAPKSSTARDDGWKDDNERDEVWAELSAKYDAIDHPHDPVDKPNRETMTLTESAEWRVAITFAEEAPF